MSSINRNNPSFPLLPQIPNETQEQVAPKGKGGARPLSKTELQQEAEQVDQQQQPGARKLSATDMERIATQAGYVRGKNKNRRGFDLGDDSQAPIPLPVDEVDESSWDQSTLDGAQEELTLQSRELKHLAEEVAREGEGDVGVIGRLIQRTFSGADGMERLQALADAAPQESVNLGAVSNSLAEMFDIRLGQVPAGPAHAAISMVVAGDAEAVRPDGDSLEPTRFVRGMQKLVENSNNAVEDARSMSSGINKQLAVHRTFTFKR